MMSEIQLKTSHWLCWIALVTAFVLSFAPFVVTLAKAWVGNPEFSYGILVPFLVCYLLWMRRGQLTENVQTGRNLGLLLTLAGCGLHVLGTFSGTLLICGAGLIVTLYGVILFLWGSRTLAVAATPIAFLMLMVPLPNYIAGGIGFRLQALASTISCAILQFFGLPVLQEGNLLRLPNYVLEVKQACSGSRSLFALLALALVLGLNDAGKRWARVLLVVVAPLLAVSTNILRIVVTGLIASRWGELAAEESLHTTAGILVFIVAVFGLLGFQRVIQWTTDEYV